MNTHIARFAAFAFAVLLLVCGASSVQAVPIDSMDGTATYILTSDGNTATISFVGGNITVVDNAIYLPPATATLGTFTINANTLDVNGFPSLGKTVDTVGGVQNGIFNFLSAELQFPAMVNTMHIEGTEVATQNTDDPTMDLTKFFDGGVFTFTLNTGVGLNFQNLIENGTGSLPGGALIGTASFSEVAAAVPEPSTIAMWCVLGLAMGGLAYRCRGTKRRSI